MNVGFIGLGRMGLPMATRLLQGGHALGVVKRGNAGTTSLAAQGARVFDSPAALAGWARYVFTMLPNAGPLLAVLQGHKGLLQGGGRWALVDMSTIGVGDSAAIAGILAEAGVSYLRAPVTGSTEYAREGRLGVMASGSRAVYESVLPLLALLGERQVWLGEGEEARKAKLVINMTLGGEMQLFAEALVLCQKAGLPWEGMIDLLAMSAAGAPLLQYKAEALKRRDFGTMSSAANMHKDMGLALELAGECGAVLPAAGLATASYAAMVAQGLGEADMSAVLLLCEEMNGLDKGL